MGEFIDFVILEDQGVREDTKIIIKLDELLLNELAEDSVLSNYSCLVVSEVQERTITIDLILGLVKQLLKNRSDFKVIVTSSNAIDIHLFESYFETKSLRVQEKIHPMTITYKNYDE
jgi:ATP-dependent helicase HrpA